MLTPGAKAIKKGSASLWHSTLQFKVPKAQLSVVAHTLSPESLGAKFGGFRVQGYSPPENRDKSSLCYTSSSKINK